MTFDQLRNMPVFTRANYYEAMRQEANKASLAGLSYALSKQVVDNNIIHIGRDQYSFSKGRHAYRHTYSETSERIASEMTEEYPSGNFQIFELVQLNAFVNHQIAHNTIFVFVENELVDYVFDMLKMKHPGKVLLKPSVEDYYKYYVDDLIVVLRLPSESPKEAGCNWHSRLEKILVDISVDKLVSKLVSRGEYPLIFNDAFSRYAIDTKAMLRYANRRGAAARFKAMLGQYAPSKDL